jgi:hypothetical protein
MIFLTYFHYFEKYKKKPYEIILLCTPPKAWKMNSGARRDDHYRRLIKGGLWSHLAVCVSHLTPESRIVEPEEMGIAVS